MIVERQCDYCHVTFARERKPGGREARFCSDRCRVAANRKRNTEQPDVTIAQEDEDVTIDPVVTIAPTGEPVTFPSTDEVVTICDPDETVTIAQTEDVTFPDGTVTIPEQVEPVTIADASGMVVDRWTGLLVSLDVDYPSPSPEWFARERALFAAKYGAL